MGAFARGEVVLIHFPFSDLSGAKLRPAFVLTASDARGDSISILSQITSKSYGDLQAIGLTDQDFSTGGLKRTSYVRPGKLFTTNEGLIVRSVGKVNGKKEQEIRDAVVDLFR